MLCADRPTLLRRIVVAGWKMKTLAITISSLGGGDGSLATQKWKLPRAIATALLISSLEGGQMVELTRSVESLQQSLASPATFLEEFQASTLLDIFIFLNSQQETMKQPAHFVKGTGVPSKPSHNGVCAFF